MVKKDPPVVTLADAVAFLARVRRGKPDQCWPFDGGAQVLVRGRRLHPQWLAMACHVGRPLWAHETVRAKCDTPLCCNAAHLRVVDKADAPYLELRPVKGSLPSTPAEAVCSYCGCRGGKGTATVCGRHVPCPVCSAPEWPELVARYGAECA